jgi:hypothetical protein
MAASFFKWLPFSLLVYSFSIQDPVEKGIGAKPFVDATEMHPFHVSTTEINHNATDKTLEISCKIFVDDFEACLSKQYHTKADLSAASMKTAMDSLVKKYLLSHLLIKADTRTVAIHYLGFEKEDVAANVYLEVENISSVKKVEVNDSILQDLYDDQINIIHVVVGGNRKSTKLDAPNKDASFTF